MTQSQTGSVYHGAQATGANAIELRNVSKSYQVPSLVPWRRSHPVGALDDASFSCPAGRISCLLGPNGAGKTTIIKILAGLVLQDAGSVAALGVSQPADTRALRGRIGLATPNERSFYWRLTGRQNLEFYATLHGLGGNARRQRVAELLSLVRLDTAAADKPYRLYSSGMKQLLLLARAMLGRPDVLLLDEPTSHLDPIARTDLQTLVQQQVVADRGTTVLWCTHDLDEAQKLADHLILLDRGRVLAQGSLEQLLGRLQLHLRVTLVFATMPAGAWHDELAASLIETTGTRMTFEVDAESQVADLVTAAISHGGRLLSCAPQREPLAEIFARMAGQSQAASR